MCASPLMKQSSSKQYSTYEPEIKCPVCNQTMNYASNANYYGSSSRYNSEIYHCCSCNILYRHVAEDIINDHYYAASYVQSRNEKRFYDSRIKFFGYILSLVKKYSKYPHKNNNDGLSILDFGSSYGHLLDLAKEEGFKVIGIEVNENLIDACRKRGLTVYEGFNEISEKVDVITMIDSLYCVPNCRHIMSEVKRCLKHDGIVIARVTNRNFYARLNILIFRRDNMNLLGDAIVNYSLKGLRKLFISTGFKVLSVLPDYARGKNISVWKKMCYLFTYLVTILTMNNVMLTPGIIIIAKLNDSTE